MGRIIDNLKKTAQTTTGAVSETASDAKRAIADTSTKTAKSIAEQTSAAYDFANQTSQKISDTLKNFKLEDVLANLKKYEKYFSESKLWKKLEKYGRNIGATILYPVFLLFNLLKSGDISLGKKAKLIGTLGYFILPIDVIPDAIAGIGYSDDAAVLFATLTAYVSYLTIEIQQLSKNQLTNLIGEYDDRAIDAISKIINI